MARPRLQSEYSDRLSVPYGTLAELEIGQELSVAGEVDSLSLKGCLRKSGVDGVDASPVYA